MNKSPTPEGLARLVRWALLIFFAYALLSGTLNLRGSKTAHPPHPQGPSGSAFPAQPLPADQDKAAVDCATQGNPLDNFSLIATSLMPTRIPTIRTVDLKPGTGLYATCGQHATLHYEYALESGTTIFSNLKSGDATHVTIGDGTLLRGIETGLIGMQPGAVRKIALPPALGFQKADPAIQHDVDKFTMKPVDLQQTILIGTVALDALSPELPSSSPPLRILERRFTPGPQAQCGDMVQVLLTGWKVDGTKIFSTEDTGTPLSFTLGMSQVPFGIEQAVAGMAEGSQRTLIMPPAFAKPLVADGDDVFRRADIQWPEETTLVEIHLDHIGAPLKPAAKPQAPITKPDSAEPKDDHEPAKP